MRPTTREATTTDPDEVGRLHATATVLRHMRLAALVVGLLQFWLYQPPPGLEVPFSRPLAATAFVASLVAINGASWWAARSRCPTRLRLAAAAETLADSALALGVVWLFSFDPHSDLWALLIIPVLEAALRARLAGALAAWAALSLGYALRDAWAASTYPDVGFGVDGVTYVAGVIGIVAVTVGLLTRELDRRTLQQQQARSEAEHRAAELAEARQLLAHRAYHDTLTDLPKRDLLLHRLQRELAAGEPAALLFLDLDGLKQVNDAHGHAAGDELLINLARRLEGTVRAGDLVARIGGDELTVLLPAPTTEDEASAAASRLVHVVGEAVALDSVGQMVRVSASLGVALSGAGREDPEQLLAAADAAMYHAKRTGGDQWVLAPTPTAADGERGDPPSPSGQAHRHQEHAEHGQHPEDGADQRGRRRWRDPGEQRQREAEGAAADREAQHPHAAPDLPRPQRWPSRPVHRPAGQLGAQQDPDADGGPLDDRWQPRR